jgi:hypothetical protein
VSWETNTQASNNGWQQVGISAGKRQLLCNFYSLHIPARIRRAFSWISWCFVVFFNILLNKTPWDQRSFGLRTFRVTNSLQEWIKFVNRGSSVLVLPCNLLIPKPHYIHCTCSYMLQFKTNTMPKLLRYLLKKLFLYAKNKNRVVINLTTHYV